LPLAGCHFCYVRVRQPQKKKHLAARGAMSIGAQDFQTARQHTLMTSPEFLLGLGKVLAVVVGVGGFLGIGEREVAMDGSYQV
jgi:hypothetical protein